MKLVIATPFYEQKAWAGYAISLANSCGKLLAPAGIEWDVWALSGDSYVDRARNTIADKFLRSDATHLMFIDSDIEWTLEAFARLVKAQGDVVAAVYPTKNRWNEYPVRVFTDKEGKPQVNGSGLILAQHAPTGFMRISRAAFERIIEDEPGNTYADEMDGGPPGERHGFFSFIFEQGRVHREDTSFCIRCARAGVRIWLEPRASLVHWGVKGWEGNYHDFLMAQPGGVKHVVDEA